MSRWMALLAKVSRQNVNRFSAGKTPVENRYRMKSAPSAGEGIRGSSRVDTAAWLRRPDFPAELPSCHYTSATGVIEVTPPAAQNRGAGVVKVHCGCRSS